MSAINQISPEKRSGLKKWPEGWKRTKKSKRVCLQHPTIGLAGNQEICTLGCEPVVIEYDLCPECFGNRVILDSYPSLYGETCVPCAGVGYFLDTLVQRAQMPEDFR